MMPDTKDPLPILYQKIADLTARSCCNGTGECAKFLGNKYRCCERQYCDLAARFARDKYGIELPATGNPDLPFMGKAGCVVPPHLRPVCALHVCTWSYAPVATAPEGYLELRSEILSEAVRQGKDPF
jgi:hypothetical protein